MMWILFPAIVGGFIGGIWLTIRLLGGPDLERAHRHELERDKRHPFHVR